MISPGKRHNDMARFLINGTVYFTESSTLIAQIKDDDVEDFQRTNTTTCLYQTRGGAFWFCTHGAKDVWHEKDNTWMYDKQISECHPTSPEMARDWFKRKTVSAGLNSSEPSQRSSRVRR
jgi:hypothetical protein